MDTKRVRALIPRMRKQVGRLLDECTYTGTLVDATCSGCSCDFWFHQADTSCKRPVVIALHGGGFALGDARKGDLMHEYVKDAFDVHVVSIGYRLAPENPFPAALDDVRSVMGYLVSHAPSLHIDVERIYLLGFSAGANLALATCISLQDASQETSSLPQPAGLVLHYPFLDAHEKPKSDGRDIDVPYDLMVAFNEFYTAGADPANPLISPALATDEQLMRLPRVFAFPVEGDALAPSCHRFCDRMRNLGLPVHEQLVHGQYHGYIEDAANLPVYLASTMTATISMRSHDFLETGWRILFASLADCLGVPEPRIAIPREGTGDLEAIYASVRGEDA